MKTKTLTGHALDFAVAIAKGIPEEELRLPRHSTDRLFRYMRDDDGKLNGNYMTGPYLLFSTHWEAGGPIIEKHLISVSAYDGSFKPDVMWEAHTPDRIPMMQSEEITGPTPLIAAMRAFVYHVFGEDVAIPKALPNC